MVRVGLFLAIGTMIGPLAGCGGSAPVNVSTTDKTEQIHVNSLTQLADLMRIRQEDAGKPPEKAADLAKYEKAYPFGYSELKRGGIVLVYGAPIADGVSDKVLAYEKAAPESGGNVLMQDGRTVKKMTAEEFKTAPKAPGNAEAKAK